MDQASQLRSSCFEMAPSVSEIAAQLGLPEDHPIVVEAAETQEAMEQAAARTARQLGTGDARGTADFFSRRASRNPRPHARALPPPTPDSHDGEAAAPATARGRLLQSAGAEAVRRRAKTPANRRPQPDAGKRTRSGPRKQRKAKDDDDDEMSSERPPSAESAATAPVQSDSVEDALLELEGQGDGAPMPTALFAPAPVVPKTMQIDATGDALDMLAHGVDRRCSLTRDDAPDAALTAVATEPTEAKAMDTSDASSDPHKRYKMLVSAKSLSGTPPAELLRVLDGLKPLAEAVKPGAYTRTCAVLDAGKPVGELAVKVIRSLVGLVGINDALAVFDAEDEDVAERARSREATLRADATRAKAEKERAAEEAHQAELASAKAAPKSAEQIVTALGFSFKLRDACDQRCAFRRRLATICTCKASDKWSSSMKLLEIRGTKRPELRFSGGKTFQPGGLTVLKLRLRPAGSGSGEDAVALLKKAAVAAGLKDAAAFFDS